MKGNWTEESVEQLTTLVEDAVGSGNPVPYATMVSVAEQMEREPRSVGAKLRNLGFEVEKKSSGAPKFTPEETAQLKDFLEENEGTYTYQEINESLFNGEKTIPGLRGKVLSMEMTGYVKSTPKKEYTSKFTQEQADTIVELGKRANDGEEVYIEDIAAAVECTENQVRGKLLALMRSGDIAAMPVKRDRATTKKSGMFDEIMDEIPDMTVSEIAERLGKGTTVVKAQLTRRGLQAKDYPQTEEE